MASMRDILVVLGILIAAVLGLMGWGFWQLRRPPLSRAARGAHDGLLLGLLVLAAFSMGVFLSYALLGVNL
jgi:hypothetical protein